MSPEINGLYEMCYSRLNLWFEATELIKDGINLLRIDLTYWVENVTGAIQYIINAFTIYGIEGFILSGNFEFDLWSGY